MCLYIMYVSKNWFYLCFVAQLLGYVVLFICLFLPESPKWLLVHGKREEAIAALNSIASVNGVQTLIPEDAVFEDYLPCDRAVAVDINQDQDS